MPSSLASSGKHTTPSRHGWLVAATAAAGAAVGVLLLLTALVIWPGAYLEVADRFRWRVGAPSVGQIKFEDTLTQVRLRGESIAGGRATLLFGDSHLHGLPGSALGGEVSNFAIAGETATRLAARIGRYAAIGKARRVVLLSGGNDLAAGTAAKAIADALATAMQQIPAATPVFLVAVPPPASVARLAPLNTLNTELAVRCSTRPRCRYIALSALADSNGLLRREFATSDGVHLSPGGYQVLADTLTNALGRSPQ